MGRKSTNNRRQAKRRAAAAAPSATAKKRKTSTAAADLPFSPQPRPLKLRLGERPRSDKDPDALTWTCVRCQKVNLPRRGLIADYPVLECHCGQECEIEFDFSIGNVMINDQIPIVQENVKTQKEDDCTTCATSTSMEITLQVRSILAGEEVKGKEVILDMNDLNANYEQALELPGVKKENKWDEGTIITQALIAKVFGVKSDEGNGSKLHKLPESVRVKKNFYDIVRVLAVDIL